MPYRRKDSPIWWASFTDEGGRRVRQSTGTTNKKEATTIETKWKLDVFQRAKWGKNPDRSFDELMLKYLKSIENNQGAWLIKTHVGHMYQMFSGELLSNLGAEEIERYKTSRISDGVKVSTINRELTTLSAAINFGRDILKWDIDNPVKGRKFREPDGRTRWITHEEADKLIKVVENSGQAPHMSDFLRLALNTGCRCGEMLGLEWSRVDLHSKLILLESEHTKNKKRRSVPLNKEAYSAIIGRASFRAEFCPDSPWVFAHKDGTRLKSVKTAFRLACKKVGIKDFRIHDLRHTCADLAMVFRTPNDELLLFCAGQFGDSVPKPLGFIDLVAKARV
jgi:integrase